MLLSADRPSHRELDRKLREARQAVARKNCCFAVQSKVVAELAALGWDTGEVPRELGLLLSEINPDDYDGSRPPERSYENAIRNSELFAFCWYSESRKEYMYLKFVIRGGVFYYVSCHRSRRKG